MKTLYDRLLEVCRDQGVNKPRGVDIQRVTGLSSGRVTQIKNEGEAARLGDDALRKIMRIGYLPDWLQEGVPPKRKTAKMRLHQVLSSVRLGHADEDHSERELIELSSHPDLKEVPRVRFKLSAGVTGYAIEPENGNGKPIFFREDWFTQHGYRPEKLFGVRVSGASMEPALWDGDLVVINTTDAVPSDGEAFALNYEGELVIKRLRRDAGEWWATSDNADQRRYAPKRCTEDVIIIGKVVYKQSERI